MGMPRHQWRIPPAAHGPSGHPRPVDRRTRTRRCPAAALIACLLAAALPAAEADNGDTSRAILFSRGLSAYDAGRYGEAAELFRSLADRSPLDREAQYYLGLSLSGAGDTGAACEVLGALHRAAPDFLPGGEEYATALIRARRWREAATVIDELEARRPGRGERDAILLLRGILAGDQGEYGRAVELLGRVAPERPDYWSRARYWRGRYLSLAGETHKALDEYSLIQEGFPLSDIGRSAAQEAEALRGAVEKGKNWWGRLSTRYEYDDNVILMPDDAPLPGAAQQGDWRFLTSFELDAVPFSKNGFDLITRYNFIQSVHNRLGNFNLHGHVADGFIRYRHPFLTPFAGYEFAYYLLDDCTQSYLRGNRIFAGVELPRTAHSLYRVLYECAFDDYLLPYSSPDDDWDTSPAGTVTLEQFLFLGAARQAFWRTAVGCRNNNARGDNFYYHGCSVVGEFYCPLPWSLSADCSAEYRFNDFTRSADNRRDRCLLLNAELRRPLREGVDLVFNYGFTRNRSDVPLYEYRRGIYSMILDLYF